jgi:hypothetical protein
MPKGLNNTLCLKHIPMTPQTFCRKIQRIHKEGNFFVSSKPSVGKGWRDHRFSADASIEDFKRVFQNYSATSYELYFGVNSFEGNVRRFDAGCPTPFGWADIDDGDLAQCDPPPNIIIESSPGRYQALWVWNRTLEPNEAEGVCWTLAQACGADMSGWDFSQVLRIPGTINHKPNHKKPMVKLLRFNLRPQQPPQESAGFRKRKAVQTVKLKQANIAEEAQAAAKRAMRRYRGTLKPSVTAIIDRKQTNGRNKSIDLYKAVQALNFAGASHQEIADIIWVTNTFQHRDNSSWTSLERDISRILGKLENDQ